MEGGSTATTLQSIHKFISSSVNCICNQNTYVHLCTYVHTKIDKDIYEIALTLIKHESHLFARSKRFKLSHRQIFFYTFYFIHITTKHNKKNSLLFQIK